MFTTPKDGIRCRRVPAHLLWAASHTSHLSGALMRTVASTAAAVIGTALMVGTPTVAYGAALKVVNASGVGSRGTCAVSR